MDTLARKQVFLDTYIGNFPLRYGGWAISEDALFDIIQYCHLFEPRVVVDYGTGTTTAFLGMYAKKMKEKDIQVDVISFDSDLAWLEDTRRILERVGVDRFVSIYHAPITSSETYGQFYDVDTIQGAILTKEVDLVIVDGPPQATQRDARYPSLPILVENLANAYCIFLDDGNREDEERIVSKWIQEFDLSFELRDYEKGLAVLSKGKSLNVLSPNHKSIIHEKRQDSSLKLIDNKLSIFSDIKRELGEFIHIEKVRYEKEKVNLMDSIEDKRKVYDDKIDKFSCQVEYLIEMLNSLRQSKSFRLGDLIFRSVKSPLKMFTFPWNFLMIMIGMRNTHQERMTLVTIPSRKSDYDKKFSKEYPVIAISLIEEGHVSKGLEFAESFVSNDNIASIEMFHAQASQDRETKWLEHINAYLKSQDLSPITLKESGESLFHRLAPEETLEEKNEGPLVTVIMPAYNSEKTIEYALRSILEQTWKNLQVLVVDDCSDDHTFEIAKGVSENDERVQVFQNKMNLGPYAGKNHMLQHAKGEYITGHDADDWAHPQRIESQLNHLVNKKALAVVSQMIRMTKSGKIKFQNINNFSFDGISRKASISFLIRADVMKKYFGHWDSVKCGADTELIERVQKTMGDSIVSHLATIMICLDHPDSLTNDKVIGTNVKGGLSNLRKLYARDFRSWHNTIDLNSAYIDFPIKKRKFDAPMEICVKNK